MQSLLGVFFLLGISLICQASDPDPNNCPQLLNIALFGDTLEHQSTFAGRYKKKDWLYNGAAHWSRHEIGQESAGIWFDGSHWVISELSNKGTGNFHLVGAEATVTCPNSESIDWSYMNGSGELVDSGDDVQIVDHEDFKTVCRGDIFQLQCDQGNFLVVTQASYGRDHNCPSECPCSVDPWHDSCLTDTLNVLTSACNGMNSCEVTGSETAWDEFFGKPCPNAAHLNVTYHCLPNYISSDKEIDCSADLTLAGFAEDNAITKYFGDYTSTMDLDQNNSTWWTNGDNAIWWSNDAWRIGLLTNLGTDNSEIVSLNNTPCPHSTDLFPDQIIWAKMGSDGSLSEYGLTDIMTTFEMCDESCLELKENAATQTDIIINLINLDNENKVEENGNYGEILKSLVTNTDIWDALEEAGAGDEEDPEEIKTSALTTVDEQVAKGKITESQAVVMKKSIEDSLEGHGTQIIFTGHAEFKRGIETQMAVEKSQKDLTNANLEKASKEVAQMGSKTKQSVRSTFNAEKLGVAGNGLATVVSAVDKFQSGTDAATMVSGVLDIASVVAQFLPPPASLITDTALSIVGIFMPGAEGPSNQQVIDEIKDALDEGFSDQRVFIEEEFEKQREFIEAQFDIAILEIEDIVIREKVKEIQTQSIAVLHYIKEKQSWLFDIDDTKALTSEELTRVTFELQTLDDTKDTSEIRQYFLTECRDSVIRNNRLQEHSESVSMCLLILYNYLTIEKYRDILLIRFLAIRNMEPDTTELTEAYWNVQKARKQVVKDFVDDIFSNSGANLETQPQDWTQTGWEGLKIQCYIAGDPSGVYVGNSFEDWQTKEIQDYINTFGISFEDYSDACLQLSKIYAQYLPIGPQTMVSTSQVVDDGNWEQCHLSNLDDYMDEDAITEIQQSCFRSNVMMACRSSSNSELEVLAWAPRENVFQITVSEGPTDSCQDPDWSNIFEGSHGEITFEYSKCKSTWTRGTWTKTEECDGARCQRGFCWRHDNPFWVDSWANPVSDPDTKWDGVNYDLRCYRLEHGRSGFYPEYAIYNPGGCMDEYHGSGFHCVCNEERCGGQVATLENGTEIGTRWYRSTGKRNGNDLWMGAWGFASSASDVSLNWVDVASDTRDAQRLSLHINGNAASTFWFEESDKEIEEALYQFNGAHRCGVSRTTFNQPDVFNGWELVFYHAN